MKKENLFFFSFPSASKFGEAKVTKSREQNKTNWFVFYAECIVSSPRSGKVTKKVVNARQEVVVYVNKHSDLMFWHIGHYINEDMGYKQYSAYGSKILATLSQRLTARYGKGYTYTAHYLKTHTFREPRPRH